MNLSMQLEEIEKIEAQRDESHIKQSSYVAIRDEKKRQDFWASGKVVRSLISVTANIPMKLKIHKI